MPFRPVMDSIKGILTTAKIYKCTSVLKWTITLFKRWKMIVRNAVLNPKKTSKKTQFVRGHGILGKKERKSLWKCKTASGYKECS